MTRKLFVIFAHFFFAICAIYALLGALIGLVGHLGECEVLLDNQPSRTIPATAETDGDAGID